MKKDEIIKKVQEIPDNILFLPLQKYLKEHSEILNYLQKVQSEYSFLLTEKDTIYFIKYGVQPYCKTCGKEILYTKIRKGTRYCSLKCANSNKDKIEKTKNIWIKTLGVDNPQKAKLIKQKTEQTCLTKYGTKNVFQSSQCKAQIKQTNLKKYGVDNPVKLDIIKNKIKQTNLQRYGVIAPLQNKTILEKSINTFLKHYNCTNPMQSSLIKDKLYKTNLKKYGYKYAVKNKNVKNKIKETNLIESFNNLIDKFKDILEPNFDKTSFTGREYYKKYSWKCKICGNIFEDHIYSHIPRCNKCYPKFLSLLQQELINFCQQYYSNIITNTRNIISPYELDIYIPEIKLAIEFNGIYYHAANYKPAGYHLMKTKMCEKLGIRLIHIWEDEWLNNKDEIKNKLKNIFENTENLLSFTENELILNRGWYTKNLVIPGYQLIKELKPQLIQRREFLVEDCGYLLYKKMNTY